MGATQCRGLWRDSANVTVFGESAGALDILALMTAPAAQKSFDKAIVESAGMWREWPRLMVAEGYGVRIAQDLGLPGDAATAQQLRRLPVEALLSDAEDRIGMGPIVDGQLLREPPPAAFAQGRASHVPLIIGTNGNEGSLLGPDPKIGAALSEATDSELSRLRSLYAGDAGDDGAFARLLFRDAHFAAPARWIAARAADAGRVYLYRFDYVMSLLRARRPGANHASEIPFVFDTWGTDALSLADRAMTELLHGCWIAFARTGTPSCTG